MRIAILLLIAAPSAVIGEWIYRSFIRPIDPLTPELLALAKHFDRSGITVRPYAVRHGFRHSAVLAVAAYRIEGFALPIDVVLCPDEQTAMRRVDSARRNPNLALPIRNGRLVMMLAMWDTEDAETRNMATRVVNAFTAFDGGATSPQRE